MPQTAPAKSACVLTAAAADQIDHMYLRTFYHAGAGYFLGQVRCGLLATIWALRQRETIDPRATLRCGRPHPWSQ